MIGQGPTATPPFGWEKQGGGLDARIGSRLWLVGLVAPAQQLMESGTTPGGIGVRRSERCAAGKKQGAGWSKLVPIRRWLTRCVEPLEE